MIHGQRTWDKENADAAHAELNLWSNQPNVRFLGAQTTKQPVVWRCQNPDCLESNLDRFFEFESDECKCPKCGLGHPAVIKRALIHFLVRDAKGPIQGDLGLRYHIGCSPTRAYIGTIENGEAGSGDLAAVNCPGCLKAVGDSLKVNGLAITISH